MSSTPFLSVVVPVYNESNRIESSLSQIMEYLSSQRYPYEIVFVDDGSTDRTVEVILKNTIGNRNVRILYNNCNKGKGHAVRKGMLNAIGQYILFIDADLSTPISELDKFLPWLGKGYAVVIGSRKVKGAEIEVHQTWLRENMAKIFTWLTNVMVTRGLSDITCGFKCFERSAAQSIFSKQLLDDWSFDAEVLFIAQKYGFSIKEAPVCWRNDPRTKVKLLKDSFQSLIGLFKIIIFNLQGKY